MKPAASMARDLLHLVGQGALGTLLADSGGQPFVSAVEFAPAADNAPLFLLSRLAEHTKNLERDARASLLMSAAPGEGGVLAQARMTIVGEVRRVDADAMLRARFLRYVPDAARYLELGDFGFFRLQAARVRLIGGFGSMGWLAGEALAPPMELSLAREAELIAAADVPAGYALLGIDAEGIDIGSAAGRRRVRFEEGWEDARGAVLVDTALRSIK